MLDQHIAWSVFLNSSGIVTTSMIAIVYDKDTPAFDTIKYHYASLMLPVAPIPVLWRSLFIKKHANPASHETRRCILDWVALLLVLAEPQCLGS